MTRTAKIFSAIAIAVFALGAGFIALVTYFWVDFQKGTKLAYDGYLAVFKGDHDTAITRSSEALQKRLTRYQRSWVYLNRGTAYNWKWKFDEAIHDFTEAIRLNPKLTDAYVGRSFAYHRKGERDKAIVDLNEAIRCDRNSASANYNRGLIHFEMDEIDRAIADYDEAVRCNPGSADPLVMRGLCHIAKGDLDRALASFDGAVAVDPMNAAGYMERSKLYLRKGENEKRERDRQQALRLNPTAEANSENFRWAISGKQGAIHFSNARTGPEKSKQELSREAGRAYAEKDFDRTIELNTKILAMPITPTETSSTIMNRGNAHHAKGNLDRALYDYDQAIAWDAQNAGAHINRALVLTDKKKRDEAMKAYAAAIRINPQMWQAYFNRAANLKQDGEFAKAINDLSEVIRLTPGYAPAYVNRAASYYQQGDVEEALNDWNRAIELNPNQIEAYVARTTVYMRKKDFAKAAQNLEETARLNPKHLDDVLNSLAWLRATCPGEAIRNGKAAVETATRACELTNWKNGDYIDTLAAAYAESGDFVQAVKFQKQALEMTKPSERDRKGTKRRLKLYQRREPYREEPKQ